jgi:hypothetical protein
MGLGLAFTSVLLFVQMLGTIAIFRAFDAMGSNEQGRR